MRGRGTSHGEILPRSMSQGNPHQSHLARDSSFPCNGACSGSRRRSGTHQRQALTVFGACAPQRKIDFAFLREINGLSDHPTCVSVCITLFAKFLGTKMPAMCLTSRAFFGCGDLQPPTAHGSRRYLEAENRTGSFNRRILAFSTGPAQNIYRQGSAWDRCRVFG